MIAAAAHAPDQGVSSEHTPTCTDAVPVKPKAKAAAAANTTPRKDPNARSITFRLPNELHDAIRVMATAEHRSLNQATCLLINEALAARKAADDAAKAELADLRRQAREAKKAARLAAANG